MTTGNAPSASSSGRAASFGKPLAGAQAEIVRVPKASTVLCPLPPGCPADRALFVGDTLATGFAAAERGGVGPGDTVVVIGAGAVGQMTSLACQARGRAVVIVVDLVADRRALAATQGRSRPPPEEVATRSSAGSPPAGGPTSPSMPSEAPGSSSPP